MKISQKLKAAIRQEVIAANESFRILLENEFRNDKMPHDQWRKLDEAAIDQQLTTERNVINKIEMYTK